MVEPVGDSKILGAVKTGFFALLSLQLLSRALTFGLNIAIARTVDRDAYGVGSVQLQLICDTILVLSREGFRDACQRTEPSDWADSRKRRKLLNVAWLSIPLASTVGTCVYLITGLLSHLQETDDQKVPGYSAASVMFVGAAGLEMLAEPLYILAHNMLLINVRVRVEMCALALKVITTTVAVAISPSAPLRAFGLGALAYGGTTLAGFALFFATSRSTSLGPSETVASLLGSNLWGSGFGLRSISDRLDLRVMGLVATMSGKALQKYFLEKGEMLVLLRFFSAEMWAMFAIVQNLASLVARLVFLPIEDMGQLAFSKLLSSNQHAAAAHVTAHVLFACLSFPCVSWCEASSARLPFVSKTLCVLTKLVVLVGSLAAAFGPAYSYSAIHILYGAKWSQTEMPLVLRWYSLFLLTMALNGITEAFTHASATPAQMRARGAMLLPVTTLYLLFACLLAPFLGLKALVIANCVNMSLRAALSLRHANNVFADAGLPAPSLPLSRLAPRAPLACTLILCGVATYALDYAYVGGKSVREGVPAQLSIVGFHVVVGVVCVGACGAVLWLTERDILRDLRDIGKEDKAKEQ